MKRFRGMRILVSALLALGVFGLVVPQAGAQEKHPSVSRSFAKPLKAAQDAMNEKKYPEALAKLRDVQGMSGATPYDQYVTNELLYFVNAKLGDEAAATRALEANLDSPYLAPADKPARVRALAQLNYKQKNYAKAIDYGNRAIKGGFADADMITLVAQAYYLSGDNKGTRRLLEDIVGDQLKRGQKPSQNHLQLILSACLKLEDSACTTTSLERLVQFYPKPEYWQNLTYSLFQDNTNSDRQMLNVYRLANDVDTLKRPSDYMEMAQLAMEQGSPGEAQAVLEKGLAKNVFTEARDADRAKRLLETAKKQAVSDRAALPAIEKDAKTGEAKVRLGQAYLSYGQYDKAISLIGAGIKDGGLKSADEANLLYGIALYKAGRNDEAVKAFKAVQTDPKFARLGKLWALHVS
ncbi:MAG: hypothetical protein IPI06_05180 [Gammaproteobacteria bacterium]|nr:hypothetical protein [Gammaproteobacteria bacterium]